MKHDTSQHARPWPPAPGPTRSASITTSDPGVPDVSDGCPVSPMIPHIPLHPRPLEDTSSEPEETALPRGHLIKVWRASAESHRASRLESGASATTAVAGEGHAPRKRCALPTEDRLAARQRTDASWSAPIAVAGPLGGSVGPADSTDIPPASAAASMALLAYTYQLYDRLETAMTAKMTELDSQINSATQSRHIGALLAKEAAEASALRMAAIECRCADLEVQALSHAGEQRASHDTLEAAVAAVSSLVGAAAADAAAARREACALREMAQQAYSTLLADASASINALKKQIGELKAQQDELAEAVATWCSAIAAPAISSESMRASRPQ